MKKYLLSLMFAAVFFTFSAHAADLFPVKQASDNISLWAYMNENGTLVTSYQYSEASSFNEKGLATVTDINGFVSVINKSFETIVPPQANPIAVEFSDDMLAFRYKSQSVFFGLDGSLIGTFPVTSGFFFEGLIPAEQNGLWGYLNLEGEFEVEPIYKKAGNFENGFAVVQFNDINAYGVLKKESYIACILPENIEPKYLRIWDGDIIIASQNGRYALYSLSEGKLLSDFIYQEITEFEDGFAVARMNNMWGLIDTKGKHVVNFQYYDLSYIGNGLYSARGNSNPTGTCSLIDSSGRLVYRTDVYAGGFDKVLHGIFWHGTLSNQILFLSENGNFLNSFENAENPAILTSNVAKITVAGKIQYVNIKTGEIIFSPEREYSFEYFKVSSATYEKYLGIDSNGNDNEWILTYPVIYGMSNKVVQDKINSQIQSFFIEGPEMPLIDQSLTGSFGISQVGRLLIVWADCVYGTGDGSAIWNSSITLDLADGTKYNLITDLFNKDYVDVVRELLPEEIPFYMFGSPRVTQSGISFFCNLSQDNNSERYSPTSTEYNLSYSSLKPAIKLDSKCYAALLGTEMGDINQFVNYADVPETHWAYEAIKQITKVELMQGSGDKFMPDNTITGVEVSSVMVRLLKIDTSTILVPDSSPWYYKEVTAAKNAGLINGIDENSLTQTITRQDVMQIIYNVLLEDGFEKMSEEEITQTLDTFSDSDKISESRREAVAACVKQKLIVGSNGKLNPEQTLTRAEFAQILSKML